MIISIGIDIGFTGAIVIRNTQFPRSEPDAWKVYDISDYTASIQKKSGGNKTVYNCGPLLDLLRPYEGAFATMEDLHAIGSPKGGKFQSAIGSPQSNYGLGYGTGIFEMALAACKISLFKVHSKTWKAGPMLKGVAAADKDAIRMRCIQLYPELAHFLSRKMDHNRAEAIFIEEFGRTTFWESM